MNTKWKKEIHNEISAHSGYDPDALENFISTEIIEKLIEDIPDRYKSIYFFSPNVDGNGTMEHITTDLTNLKDQLKSKYLL